MSSPPYRFSDGSPNNAPRGDTVYVEEPVEDATADLAEARLTNNPAHQNVRPDAGYLMKGWRRVLVGSGDEARWVYTQAENDLDPDAKYQDDPPDQNTPFHPPDLYADKQTFPNSETSVQVVEFRRETKVPAKWLPPLTNPETINKVLRVPPKDKDAWRWIHCTGLHGPSLKAVAQATGWDPRKFGGIFTWTRASVEWADDILLTHFQNQGTRIFMWYGGGKYPMIITGSTLNPQESSVTRIFDFVDHGCSRPEVVLREDPSLLYYGVVRAVIQDLRYSVHHISHKMGDAFNKSTAQPSQSNLSFFYHLQDRLFILGLDTTSLKNAAATLIKSAEDMAQRDANIFKETGKHDPKRLISERSQFMLKDQQGLINLLSQELPDVSKRASAIVDLAFNTLAFNTNNWLQLLAVLTLAALPLSFATGILGINYFDADHITPKTIGIVLAVVGGLVIIGLAWYTTWFLQQRQGGDDGSKLAGEAKSKQTEPIAAPKQTAAQRYAWARAQDLDRDNRLIVEKKQHDPMMREYPEHLAPSPRSTSPTNTHPPLANGSVTRRSTMGGMFDSSSLWHRRNNHASLPNRSPEAAAEEGNNLDSIAIRNQRTNTSPTVSERSPERETFGSVRHRNTLASTPSEGTISEGQEISYGLHRQVGSSSFKASPPIKEEGQSSGSS